MTCWPYMTRRERFRRWRERLRTRVWRRLHPTQARAQDGADAAMWRRIGPLLAKSPAPPMVFGSPLDNTPLAQRFRTGLLGTTPGFDWYMDATLPPQPWHRRAYWRVSGWVWRIIEAF